MQAKVRELIVKLRQVREEKGISYQKIVDICETNGEPVSISTVKRVFAQNADGTEFRYDTTLRPIVRAVIGIDTETEEPNMEAPQDQLREFYAENAAMKSVISLKNEIIVSLNQTIQDKNADIQRIQEAADRKVDYLKKLVDKSEVHLEKLRRWLAISSILAAVFALVIIVALAVDAINPNVGFFWLK